MQHVNTITTVTISTNIEDWLNTLAESLSVAKAWKLYRSTKLANEQYNKVEIVIENQEYVLNVYKLLHDGKWHNIQKMSVTEQEKEHIYWLESIAVYLNTHNSKTNLSYNITI